MRHMFHYEGLTDLSVMRREAARSTEPVTIHLHEYDDAHEGCANGEHELFDKETPR